MLLNAIYPITMTQEDRTEQADKNDIKYAFFASAFRISFATHDL